MALGRGATLTLIAETVLVLGCSPVYAPPIRTHHYAPRRHVEDANLEVIAGTVMLAMGTVLVNGRVSERLQIEGGAEGSEDWLLGVIGLRADLQPPDSPGWLKADLELGGGAGVGGVCDHCDDRSPFDRRAAGAYTGIGLSAGNPTFAVRLRGRVQVSSASGLPRTTWYTAAIGPQFRTGRAKVHLAAGAGMYTNAADSEPFGFLEAAVGAGLSRSRGRDAGGN